MESNYKRLGDFIRLVDLRNTELKVKTLLGVSIEKKFIPSIANTIGTDMKSYKIVKKGQFAYGTVTSRNGDKVSIALLKDYDECIISSAYLVFEIIDERQLNPDYLMMLFSNPEFDRYARYNSWGSAREVFSWDELCRTEMKIPSIEEQEKIVRQYKDVKNRIRLLNDENNKIHKMIGVYFNHIVFNKDKNGKLGDLIAENPKSKIQVGEANIHGEYIFFTSGEKILKHNNYIIDGLNLFLNTGGKFDVKIYKGKAAYSTDTYCIKGTNNYTLFLYFQILNNFDKISSDECFRGSALKHLKKEDMKNIDIYIPDKNEITNFNKLSVPAINRIMLNNQEIEKLSALINILTCRI